jgi:hypothetical protein
MIEKQDNTAALLQAATDYANRGWPVFPVYEVRDGQCACGKGKECKTPGKHPATTSGFKDASTNPETINEWVGRNPGRNIGMATGSEHFVIDVDAKHNGHESLKELEEKLGPLPETLRARTGGGGEHLHFRSNRPLNSTTSFSPGLDLKAEGGYVVMPPSTHVSGTGYTWDNLDQDIASIPDAWLKFLQSVKKQKSSKDWNYGAEEGERNDKLFRYACKLRGKGFSHQAILEECLKANESYNPPLNTDEVEKIVESASKYEAEPIADPNFFTNIPEQHEDLVEDFLPSGHLTVIAGYFNVGKSPFVEDLATHVAIGRNWMGKKVSKRPVVFLDSESSESQFKLNIMRVCQRLGADWPNVPDELEPLLMHGRPEDPGTQRINRLLESNNLDEFLREILDRKPNALVVIDPADCVFRVDTKNEGEMLKRYMAMKVILGEYREASIILILNLRKEDRSNKMPELHKDPRGWLMEVRGSMAQLDRADTRIGFADYGKDDEGRIKVVNGLIRGRDFYYMFVKPVQSSDDEYCGYSLCDPGEVQDTLGFTTAENNAWATLEPQFTWDEAKSKGISQGTLKRTIDRAKSLGILKKDGNLYRKVYGTSSNNSSCGTP